MEQFGRAVPANFVHFLGAFPSEPDGVAAVFDIEARLERPEGDFAMAVVVNRYRRWSAEIEISAIPDIGFDDPPAGD